MKTIFNRTLTSMFKPLGVSIYYSLVIISTILFSIAYLVGDSYQTIESQKLAITEIYVLLNFIWLSGILLNLKVLITGTGLFAAEESSGTMRMLFARPLKRSAIIIGKILGLFVGSLIYMISSIVISMGLYSLIIGIDRDVLLNILKIIPSFIIYGLFIIILFGGLSSLFSSLFKGRVPALIIMIILVLLTFGILPIGRLILSSFGKYEKFYIYYLDTNYHIGNIYVDILEKNDNFKMSPVVEDSLGVFTGAYVSNYDDKDKTDESYVYYSQRERSKLLNTSYIFIIYSAIAVASYIVCFNRMSKKDIN